MLDRIKADDFLTIYAEGKVKIDTVFAWGLGIEVSSLVEWRKQKVILTLYHSLKIFENKECVE